MPTGEAKRRTVLTSARAVAVVEADATEAIASVRAAIGALDPLEAVVAALSAPEVRALATFGIAIRDGDGLRLFVRGDVVARVVHVDGRTDEVGADGVRTWSERLLAEVVELELLDRSEQADVMAVMVLAARAVPVLPAAAPAEPVVAPTESREPALDGSELAGVDLLASAEVDGSEHAAVDDAEPAEVDAPGSAEFDAPGSEARDDSEPVEVDAPEPQGVDAPEPESPERSEPARADGSRPGPFDGSETLHPQGEPAMRADEEPGAVVADGAPAEPDSGDDEPATPPPARLGSADAQQDDFDFSHLIEETRYRGVEAAAVRESPGEPDLPGAAVGDAPPVAPPAAAEKIVVVEAAAEAPPAPVTALIEQVPAGASTGAPRSAPPDPTGEAGDHDGYTISVARLRAVTSPASAPTTWWEGPKVQAVACTAGHLSPPHASECRECGGPILDRSVRLVARPPLGRLEFVGGPVVTVDRPLLVGRRPTVTPGAADAEVPGLVTLPDAEKMLSRTHCELRLDGWEVLVVDRQSANGTTVELPGKPPERLRPNQPCMIVPGTRVELGGVVSCRFEVGQR